MNFSVLFVAAMLACACRTNALLFVQGGGVTVEQPESSQGFPDIPGWSRRDTIDLFGGSNLYDRIDGAADLFLTYAFRDLRVAEYRRSGGASVIVELYRFETPLDAFGMYSQERPSGGRFLPIGAQAYIEDPVLNFLTGSTYVKITAFDLRADVEGVLRQFASGAASAIGGTTSLPPALALFPAEGKKPNSERYVSQNLLGYSCFRRGFTADYREGDRNFQLLLIEGTGPGECREMLEGYFGAVKESRKELAQGVFELKDPHHGEITLAWKGRYLYGVLHLQDRQLRDRFAGSMGKLLP